jgi:gamma-glutamyltranspeptidase/glutathione hydrolase
VTRRLSLLLVLALGGCAALRGGSTHQDTPNPAVLGADPAAPQPAADPLPASPPVPGVVASAHPLASQAGAAALSAGGNAFDAAVATALVLGVVNPQSSGIGGGGFAVFRVAGAPVRSVDFRETAPSFFTSTTYLEDEARSSSRGPWSVGVPGEVAGLGWLHAEAGSLPWARVVEPARKLAADGFPVGSDLGRALAAMQEQVLSDPGMAADFAPDGIVLKEGETCRRPALARTLEYVELHGAQGFYAGPVAVSIAGFLAGQGVPWTEDELARYAVRERQPLAGTYRGLGIHTMGPPSSGGIALVQTLGLMERTEQHALPFGSASWTRLLAQGLSHAFADRATYGGDPDHVEVPVSDLTSAATLDALARRMPASGPIGLLESGLAGLRGDSRGVVPDDGGTSHLSVLDAQGNAVALTTTVNLWFGSGQIDPGTGIVLNDEMDDFAARPGVPNAFGLVQSERNAPSAGRRPLSSMTPTLVTNSEGDVILAVGGAGGPRIITGTLQALLGVVDRGASAAEAVGAPRIHHQWLPQEVFVEASFPEDGRAGLTDEGFSVATLERGAIVQAATWDPTTGTWDGAADPRGGGAAVVVPAP